ncbi:MAG: beta-ketoacyl-ACP synthase III [Candidatus Kapaibacterium sp.]
MTSNIRTRRATITSVGHYVPPDIFNNDYFKNELGLETDDTWIRERTGIIERRYLVEGGTSDLAVPAIKKCLERRGISALEIDCIIVATVTPDMAFPSTACLIQNKIGAKNAWGFDVEAACSGFLFALRTGTSFIESGQCKKVLVVGADKMSAIINFKDRNTCVLFGDGAGCVLLEATEDETIGIIDFELHIDGSGGDFLYMPAGGSRMPPSLETVARELHYVVQDGKAVFKVAVIGMADVAESIMKKNNLTAQDIRWLVPHQANLRIISATAERMGLSMENVMVNIHKFGNTTAGTLPICLGEWWENGLLKKGDGIILATFGAGYTWGSGYLKWGY